MHRFFRLLSLLILADGLISALLGKHFQILLLRISPAQLKRIPAFFMDWPEPLLRLGTLFQSLAGAWLFRKVKEA